MHKTSPPTPPLRTSAPPQCPTDVLLSACLNLQQTYKMPLHPVRKHPRVFFLHSKDLCHCCLWGHGFRGPIDLTMWCRRVFKTERVVHL
mmetsp:Transcript_79918/g.133493  ORF Transcript_79918/g.133493 Transcript_79918/m.133493 type:complete len:89 (-) Transcript_79918:196-462(-)